VICVEEIDLGGRGLYTGSFNGWSIKKVSEGTSDKEEITKNDGKKVKPFNFSGTLKTLPEFHRALRKLTMSAETNPFPDSATALTWPPDEFGIINISKCGQSSFTDRIFRFGDFATYVEYTMFRAISGQFTTKPKILS
jgi:hypothetical protein